MDFKKRLENLRIRRGETKKQFEANTKRLMDQIANPPAEYDRKYKLQGRINWHGLDIAIENKKGSYRTGKDPDGKPWKTYMNFAYGRITGSKAVDNEGVDCYIGPDDLAEKIYVIHQQDPFRKVYDEDKCMIGFVSREAAIEAYLSQYNRPDFLGPISKLTITEFKEALKNNRGTMLYKSPIEYNADEMRKNKTRIVIRKK
jgi:hypothetical protein